MQYKNFKNYTYIKIIYIFKKLRLVLFHFLPIDYIYKNSFFVYMLKKYDVLRVVGI